jgi:hypothetical protein
VLVDPYLTAVYAFDILSGDDFPRRSRFINPSSLKENQPVTKFGGHVHIVRGHDNGQTPLPIEGEDEVEKIDLMMDV